MPTILSKLASIPPLVRRAFLSICVLAEAFVGGSAHAEMVTDRPDVTESPLTVLPSHVQIEAGLTAQKQAIRLPETLFRIGTVENVEARLAYDGLLWGQGFGVARSQGIGIGAKVHLWGAPDAGQDLAVLAELALPVQTPRSLLRGSSQVVLVSFAHDLTDNLSMGYNAGIELHDAFSAAPLAIGIPYSASLAIELAEKTGMFVEVFGEMEVEPRTEASISFDSGLTYAIQENLQFDGALGVQLYPPPGVNDVFVVLGISGRLPD